MPTPTELRALVSTRADALGFAKVGVARADAVQDAERFRSWLADGRQGTMGWLEEKNDWRLDPREYFPGCRSIIVVAERYWSGEAEPGPCGRVSNYAWGDGDYHDHMLTRLKKLGAAVDAAANTRSKAVVDTAPVLEKYWAARAGIGWIGKHTNVLSRDIGSWFFLGVVLTTADIAANAPVPDHCGTCTACLDACPTDAFPAPYELDARRCISYLTIEHRGPIDDELRAQMGDHLFGCDICQAVCPWNDEPFIPVGEPYGRDAAWDRRTAAEVFQWSQVEFKAAVGGTPVYRAKRAGLARNLAVVLGNRGAAQDVDALRAALDDEDAAVRDAAAWALARLGHSP